PPALFRFHVDADAALVPGKREEIGAHAVPRVFGIRGQQFPRPLPGSGRLDLDRLRTKIGQQHGAVRPREHVGKIQDYQVRQGFHRLTRKMETVQAVATSGVSDSRALWAATRACLAERTCAFMTDSAHTASLASNAATSST